jgi:hypothetical protein
MTIIEFGRSQTGPQPEASFADIDRRHDEG